ncbi:MAG TPA: hypothetical protein VGB40_03095, partial [Rubrobacteraceae bacterium]
MRVWLTALFVLVTAFAAVTAYEIVRPIMEESLNQASKAAFRQVGHQFEGQVQQLRQRGQDLTVDRIRTFASTRGLQWGIVQSEGKGGTILEGNLEGFLPGVVQKAVAERRPR